jgi:sarcosine oxidase, subunit beta
VTTIIVGGGIVGTAVAYFLAERREPGVILLERAHLGDGTSKGGLGGIRHQFADELDVRMSKLATTFWRNYDDLTGARHDFRQRGYLFLANTAEGLEQLRAPLPLYERVGVNVEMVDRVVIRDLVPDMRVDDLAGGRLGAEDGYGDPIEALAGFAAFAQLGGVRIREGVTVRRILRDGDRVTGVATDDGEIAADRVLLATGCWTAALAATAGVPVPIWPYARSIMESQPIPLLRSAPMVVEWESGFHFRPKGNAVRFAMPNLTTVGGIEKGPGSPPASFVPGEFSPLVVPPGLEPWVKAKAAWRHPLLANVQIRASWACYYEMTPDDHPIVGAVPGVEGLYIAAGFSGHGFMHAPATARLIVEEMLDGRAETLDISDLSLARFQTGRRPFTATVL